MLAPWQRTEVRGWRKNMGEVAEFYFTDLPDSYAARTGRPQNVGVIGVAVFRESVPLRRRRRAGDRASDRDDGYYVTRPRGRGIVGSPRRSRHRPPVHARSRTRRRNRRRQELGTGHGQRRYDPASYTAFERRRSSPG